MGMQPDIFWRITPWQFRVCLDGYRERVEQNRRAVTWQIWHTEALQRQKKMPSLQDMLDARKPDDGPKKEVPTIDENAIIGRMKAYNARLAGKA